jgi:SAM-dependent methyltransferase
MFSMKKHNGLIVIMAVVCGLNAWRWQGKQPDVIFVPTPDRVVEEMLRMADIQMDDTIYDLGCGDGRIVIRAAQTMGSRGVGIDVDPQRIKESVQNAKRAGVEHLVKFIEQDLFQSDLKEATVVTLYLLPMLNLRLRPKLLTDLRPGSRVISHDFGMNEWLPDQKTVVVIGERHHWVYSWIVPANIIGQWELFCPELRDGTPITMYLEQVYQHIIGSVLLDDVRKHLRKTKLTGNQLQFELRIHRGRDVLSVVFNGEVQGDVMAGDVTLDRGSRIEKYPWRAVRDPRTMEPIDVLSFMRSLYDKTKR